MGSSESGAPRHDAFHPENAEAVQEALVRDLYARGRTAVVFLVAALVLFREIFGRSDAGSVSRVVYALVCAAVVGRFLLALALERPTRLPPARARCLAYVAATALVGTTLGALVFVTYGRADALGVALLAAFMTGIHSVALASMAPSRAAYLVYMAPSLGVLVVLSAWSPKPGLGASFTILVAVYAAALVVMALHANGSLRRLLSLKIAFRDAARRDGLTGLRNRVFVDEALAGRADPTIDSDVPRPRRNLGVVMLDVDHFKAVNDAFGHDAGDAILRHVGNVLARTVRRGDLASRWGGDEFLLVLPDVTREAMASVSDRIRRSASGTPIRLPGGAEIRRTCSVGWTLVALEDGVTLPQILESARSLADRALYEAKARGRDVAVGLVADRGRVPIRLVEEAVRSTGVTGARTAGLLDVVEGRPRTRSGARKMSGPWPRAAAPA